MPMDMPVGMSPTDRTDRERVGTNLTQAIGLALDHKEGRFFVTHSGSVSQFELDGTMGQRIGMNGSTGIAFARIP
jgi:hypothetical protein